MVQLVPPLLFHFFTNTRMRVVFTLWGLPFCRVPWFSALHNYVHIYIYIIQVGLCRLASFMLGRRDQQTPASPPSLLWGLPPVFHTGGWCTWCEARRGSYLFYERNKLRQISVQHVRLRTPTKHHLFTSYAYHCLSAWYDIGKEGISSCGTLPFFFFAIDSLSFTGTPPYYHSLFTRNYNYNIYFVCMSFCMLNNFYLFHSLVLQSFSFYDGDNDSLHLL